MFSVKGFAAGKNVTPSSGSAAAAIMASNIAVSIAAPKRAVSSVELQTSATEKLWKESWINATDSEPIDQHALRLPRAGFLHYALLELELGLSRPMNCRSSSSGMRCWCLILKKVKSILFRCIVVETWCRDIQCIKYINYFFIARPNVTESAI
jgi:hypothetical protein